MTDSFNNWLLLLTAGQAAGGQRLEMVPAITNFKSGGIDNQQAITKQGDRGY